MKKDILLLMLCLFCSIGAMAQTKTITGVVSDAAGEPIIGASVVEVGTTNGTITDIDGKFVLNMNPDGKIRVSYIGYQVQTIFLKGKTSFRIQMKEYSDIAHELDLECLVEVHNEEEYKKTLGFKPDMLGINNRNLYTFDVDLETTGRLSNIVGDHAVLVSESGIKTNADMKKVRSLGADAVLIGETLMRSGNIGTTLHELREGV